MTDVRPRVSEQEAGKPAPARSLWWAAVDGILAGAVAIGVATLLVLWPPAVIASGYVVVSMAPKGRWRSMKTRSVWG